MFFLEVLLDWKSGFFVDEGISCWNHCTLYGYWEVWLPVFIKLKRAMKILNVLIDLKTPVEVWVISFYSVAMVIGQCSKKGLLAWRVRARCQSVTAAKRPDRTWLISSHFRARMKQTCRCLYEAVYSKYTQLLIHSSPADLILQIPNFLFSLDCGVHWGIPSAIRWRAQDYVHYLWSTIRWPWIEPWLPSV